MEGWGWGAWGCSAIASLSAHRTASRELFPANRCRHAASGVLLKVRRRGWGGGGPSQLDTRRRLRMSGRGCRQWRCCCTSGIQPGFVSVKSGLALRVPFGDGPNVAHLCFFKIRWAGHHTSSVSNAIIIIITGDGNSSTWMNLLNMAKRFQRGFSHVST